MSCSLMAVPEGNDEVISARFVTNCNRFVDHTGKPGTTVNTIVEIEMNSKIFIDYSIERL